MIELIKLALSSFWTFFGFLILLSCVLEFLFKVWNRFWRHWGIRKHGYPPPHCDADGDFREDD